MNNNKPNVILIYPDEMRYDAMSASGNPTCKTPNIDELINSGVNFTSAYSSFPLCCPFRGSLMTGKYPHKNGMMCNHIPIPLDQTFLPEFMKGAGYRTGWIGKWHLDGGKKFQPVQDQYQLGFDEFVGYSRGHHYVDSIYYRGSHPQAYKSTKYEPEYQTDHLIDFMDRAVNDNVPFLGMICFGIPHHPVTMAPPHYTEMYNPEDVVLPSTVPEWKREHSKKYRAHYYGLVTCVDDQVGRINKYLEEKGIKDNTMLIFVSDHGDMCSEFGLEDKYVCHESSAHVPYIIQYPNMIKKQTAVAQMVDPAVTIVPTILDACGIEIPDYMPGKSLLNSMENGFDQNLDGFSYYQCIQKEGKVLEQESLLSEQKPYGERGFRTKELLYVEKCGVPFKMYDLTIDPLETCNCVDNSFYVLKVKEAHEKLKQIMESVDDSWDVKVTELPDDYQSHSSAEKTYPPIYNSAIYEEV